MFVWLNGLHSSTLVTLFHWPVSSQTSVVRNISRDLFSCSETMTEKKNVREREVSLGFSSEIHVSNYFNPSVLIIMSQK